MSPFGKPGPTLNLRDESPVGENRGGAPAGERARKRRAAQAALLRGASRTPLACGHLTPASAGVPLPYFLPEARLLDWASVKGLAEAASFFVARMSAATSGIEFDASMLSPDCASLIRATALQNSGAKNAPRER